MINYIYNQIYLAMKFIILTFVRTSELRFADWTEFDIDCTDPSGLFLQIE